VRMKRKILLFGMSLLPTIKRWEEDSSDEKVEDTPPLRSSQGVLEGLDLEEVELTPNMDASFEWEATHIEDGGEWRDARLTKLRTITQG
jgi:hypothetical protein